MALAFQTTYRDVWGGVFVRRVQITLDNAYPNGGSKATNGWAITAKQLGFGSTAVIIAAWVLNDNLDGYDIEWDAVNGRIHIYQGDNTNAAAAPNVELVNNSAVMNNKVVNLLVIATGQHL